MSEPTTFSSALQPSQTDVTAFMAGLLGTLFIHAAVIVGAIYFSRPVEEKTESTPPRTIVTTELTKLGGGIKLPPQAMPNKKIPPVKKNNAMADPFADPNKPEVPTSEDGERKPSLDELLKKNLSQGQSDAEGEGDGNGEGDGLSKGSTNGTGRDPNALSDWSAEVGSLFRKYLVKPTTISDAACKKLFVEVRLTLDNNLQLIDYKIETPSSSAVFDSAVGPAFGRMVDEKVKIPMPPTEAGISKAQLTSGRVLLEFRCSGD